MWIGKKQRVRLKVDLTRYDSRCKEGEEGWLMPGVKLSWWDEGDNFGAVFFDNGAQLSVNLKSLEFLEEDEEKSAN